MPDERFEDHLRHPRGRGRAVAGGMIVRASERPIATGAGQPNSSSARVFQAMIVSSASIETNASCADSMTATFSASCVRLASRSACSSRAVRT